MQDVLFHSEPFAGHDKLLSAWHYSLKLLQGSPLTTLITYFTPLPLLSPGPPTPSLLPHLSLLFSLLSGFTRRFDPLKPVTRAQAAAALVCGDSAEPLASKLAEKEQAERKKGEGQREMLGGRLNGAQPVKAVEVTRGDGMVGKELCDAVVEVLEEVVRAWCSGWCVWAILVLGQQLS